MQGMQEHTALRNPQLHYLGPEDSEGIIESMNQDGYALVEDFISPELVEETRKRIDQLKPGGLDRVRSEETPGHFDHYKCVFNRDAFWLQFIDRPGCIDALEMLLGPDCHITGQTAWRKYPGQGGAAVSSGHHVDHLLFPVPEELVMNEAVNIPLKLLTMNLYLNDITEDLCPTWVIPGSHKSGRGPGHPYSPELSGFIGGDEWSYNNRDEEVVTCKAGSALFFRSDVWHRGSPNTSEETRYMLQVHYGAREMSQRFSPYTEFTHNPEILKAANERQLRLLGKHRPMAYD